MTQPELFPASARCDEALRALVRVMVHLIALRAAWPDRAPTGVHPSCWAALCTDMDHAHAVIVGSVGRVGLKGETPGRTLTEDSAGPTAGEKTGTGAALGQPVADGGCATLTGTNEAGRKPTDPTEPTNRAP